MSAENTPTRQQTILLYGFLLLAFAVLYAVLMRPHMAGFEYDDGAYLLAARALAHGQGYVLPYAVPAQGLVKYPPLLSMVLAPLWWLPVSFPQNIIIFKGLNLLLTLAFLGMLAFYAERVARLPRWQSVCLLLLTGLHFQFIHGATEILSEPLFLVLLMITLLLAHQTQTTRNIVIMLILAVLAYYARTVGILFVVALGLWHALNARKKAAALSLGLGLLACGFWIGWCNAQPDFTEYFTLNGRDWVLRTLNESYFTSIKTDLLYHYTWFDLYTTGLAALYGKWANEFLPLLSLLPFWAALVVGFGLLGVFMLNALQCLREKHVTLSGVFVTLYLAVLPFWAYHDQYPRFVMVVLPFLLIWLFQLANKAHAKFLPPQTPHVVIPVMVLVVTVCNLIPVTFRIQNDLGDTLTLHNTPPIWSDFLSTTAVIRKYTTPNDMLWVVHRVMPYALYTDRHYFEAFIQLPPKYLDGVSDDQLPAILKDHATLWRQELIRRKVRYVVSNPVLLDGKMKRLMDTELETLLATYPDDFRLLYMSPNRLISIFEFTGQ